MKVLYIPSKRATTLVIKIKSDWLASQFVSQSTNLNLLFCYLLYEGPQVAMPKTPDIDVAHPQLQFFKKKSQELK